MTTATDLLFTGGREGYFHALDARTGELLWKASLGGQIVNAPVSYEIDGQQYIATISGNNLVASRSRARSAAREAPPRHAGRRPCGSAAHILCADGLGGLRDVAAASARVCGVTAAASGDVLVDGDRVEAADGVGAHDGDEVHRALVAVELLRLRERRRAHLAVVQELAAEADHGGVGVVDARQRAVRAHDVDDLCVDAGARQLPARARSIRSCSSSRGKRRGSRARARARSSVPLPTAPSCRSSSAFATGTLYAANASGPPSLSVGLLLLRTKMSNRRFADSSVSLRCTYGSRARDFASRSLGNDCGAARHAAPASTAERGSGQRASDEGSSRVLLGCDQSTHAEPASACCAQRMFEWPMSTMRLTRPRSPSACERSRERRVGDERVSRAAPSRTAARQLVRHAAPRASARFHCRSTALRTASRERRAAARRRARPARRARRSRARVSSFADRGRGVTAPCGCDTARRPQRPQRVRGAAARRRIGGQRITIDVQAASTRTRSTPRSWPCSTAAARRAPRALLVGGVGDAARVQELVGDAPDHRVLGRHRREVRRAMLGDRRRRPTRRCLRRARTARARTTRSSTSTRAPPSASPSRASAPTVRTRSGSRCRAAATSSPTCGVRSSVLNGPLPVVFVTARALLTTLKSSARCSSVISR